MPRPRATAAAASVPGEGRGCQFIKRGGALDHLDAARIGQPAQPELDRIDAGRRRELVGEAFDREAVRDLAGRADFRRPQRRVLQPVHDHLHGCRPRRADRRSG